MPDLVPANEFALVHADETTPDLVREYHDLKRQKERELNLTPGKTPLADRLDTESVIEQNVPGEVIESGPPIEDELLAQIEPNEITQIVDPSGAGPPRVFDSARLDVLLELIQKQREAYLEAHQDRRPPVEQRVVKPELRFETRYVAPVEFALAHDACGIKWEFFAPEDVVYVRWPDRPCPQAPGIHEARSPRPPCEPRESVHPRPPLIPRPTGHVP